MIEEKYQHKPSWQILIFSGKVLSKENTIKSYNVTENDFLVLMVKKPKEEEEAKPAEKPQTAPSQPAPTSAPAPTVAQEPRTVPPPPQPSNQITPPQIPLTDPISGQSVNAMVDSLADMGFPRDQALLALRASFFNVDRAVEYLTNGIPSGALSQPAPATRPSVPSTPASGGEGGIQLPENLLPPGLLAQQQQQQPQGGGMFDMLRRHPQLALLQQIAREDPERLTEILAQLAQTNPQILQLIMQNRDEFIQLLSEGAGGGGLGGAPPPGTVMVSAEDQQKIQNLIAITGASRDRVMQAYFLFEKDETMAVNYLLNNPDE